MKTFGHTNGRSTVRARECHKMITFPKRLAFLANILMSAPQIAIFALPLLLVTKVSVNPKMPARMYTLHNCESVAACIMLALYYIHRYVNNLNT